jgi:hypothetical protein
MKCLILIIGLVVASPAVESPPSAPALAPNPAVVEDIIQKKVDVSRWGDRGKGFQFLRIGMTRAEVWSLLGPPDGYPKDRPDILQFPPDDHFHGGDAGPDWALVLEMESDRVKEIRFSKWVYGPPPG